MVSSDVVHRRPEGGFKQWVLHGYAPARRAGPYRPYRPYQMSTPAPAPLVAGDVSDQGRLLLLSVRCERENEPVANMGERLDDQGVAGERADLLA